MSEDISVKRAPENLRKLEIGQTYNGNLNIFNEEYCLNLQKLYEDDMLKFVSNEVIEYYSFRDFSTEITDHSVFDIGGGIKGGGLTASLSAAYNYYHEKASMLKENKLSAEIYKVRKVSIWLRNLKNMEGNLGKYMKETTAGSKFRAAYQEVIDAKKKSPIDHKLAVEKFKLAWGTGIISRLELMGGAIAEIEFSSTSSDAKSNTVHEGEMSFESKFVSAKGKLQLSDEIRKFSLSVKQTGSVVSFPSEVRSYKDFIKAQVDYIRKYIEGKATEAAAPDFTDTRNPITAKDLNLKEKEKPKEKSKQEVMEDDMGTLEKEVDLTTNDSLLNCIGLIYKYEKDPVEIAKVDILKGRFETGKKLFRLKFNAATAKLMAAGEAGMTEADKKFIAKLDPEISKVKQFKLAGATAAEKKDMFTAAEMDPFIAFVAKIKALPA